jgi:hypothetical protein
MTEQSTPAVGKDSISQLLIFKIEGVSFGVDARLVSGIDDPQSIDPEKDPVLKLHDVIPFKEQSIEYKSPKLLLVKTSSGSGAIYVESPDDIVFLNAAQIKPMPTVILKLNASNAIWGVFVREGRTILVIDPCCLIKEGQLLAGKSEFQ